MRAEYTNPFEKFLNLLNLSYLPSRRQASAIKIKKSANRKRAGASGVRRLCVTVYCSCATRPIQSVPDVARPDLTRLTLGRASGSVPTDFISPSELSDSGAKSSFDGNKFEYSSGFKLPMAVMDEISPLDRR